MNGRVLAPAEDALWARMEQEIAATTAGFRGVISLSLKDIASGRTLQHKGDLIQAAGSSIKIPVLMELFRKAHEGQIDLDKICVVSDADKFGGSGVLQHMEGDVAISLRNHAVLMINLSDNVCTNVCIEHAAIGDTNELMASLGCNNTKLQRLMIGNPPEGTESNDRARRLISDSKAAAKGRENITSANDMVRWLEALVRGQLVNSDVSASVLSVLRKPKASPIRAAIPTSLSIASKTGGLEGARCEVALVEQRRRPYIVAIMTTFGVDDDNSAMITDVARVAHSYLGLWENFTEYGRGLPDWAFKQ